MIRNLVSRNKQHVKAIVNAGAATLIRYARCISHSTWRTLRSAFRELNCDISDMKHYRDQGRAMTVCILKNILNNPRRKNGHADQEALNALRCVIHLELNDSVPTGRSGIYVERRSAVEPWTALVIGYCRTHSIMRAN